VLAKVEDLQREGCTLKIITVTGHSLGGALAALAAIELRRAYPAALVRVYTFGAPRVGNRAFSALYDAHVPDTWAVVNLEDPVPRVPKGPFKGPRRRVVLTNDGDALVCPSFFEVSLVGSAGGYSAHHGLGPTVWRPGGW
jgi:acetyl esterase/lipase